jgi:hypothetical protein
MIVFDTDTDTDRQTDRLDRQTDLDFWGLISLGT